MYKTVGVCGFVSTGSSAIVDFLKEFDENKIFDSLEFFLSYVPDGLVDLYYHLFDGFLYRDSSIVAIERFLRLCHGNALKSLNKATGGRFITLSDNFIDAITLLCWKGRTRADYYLYPSSRRELFRYTAYALKRITLLLESVIKVKINLLRTHQYRFTVAPEDFILLAQKYVRDILACFYEDEYFGNYILDQPYSPTNPQKCFPFFDNPSAVIVDRDPRDLYLHGEKFLRPRSGRMYPSGNVYDFVKYFRRSRQSMNMSNKDLRIIYVQYEDMVYEYKNTTKRIEEFLSLNNHNNPKKWFDPEKSINNTQLVTRFPEYEKDVAYIEAQLPEYLYNFNRYPTNIPMGPMIC